ncbi:MAG: hypothetical protein KF760_09445 [Candidatus Eremiobacteraeota bacterium]|nr:hypothetical protein [Candidatus Eremiobacteraeota bacterium]MCW5866253.1 hypothetical protein [Candidatus Eremiobacteraeota bacterium]
MISLVISEDKETGEQRIETMLDWKNFAEPEDRHDQLDETVNRLHELYQGQRFLYTRHAQNLFTFLQENPALGPNQAVDEVKGPQ